MKVTSIISQQFTGYKRLQRKLPVNNLIQPWEFENLSFGLHLVLLVIVLLRT